MAPEFLSAKAMLLLELVIDITNPNIPLNFLSYPINLNKYNSFVKKKK
jgi:hypothetical protein